MKRLSPSQDYGVLMSLRLAWDAENRLTRLETGNSSTNSWVTLFEVTYDGDGRRVRRHSPGATSYYPAYNTVYVGSHYEAETVSGEVTQYYFFGGQRIALWRDGSVYYLLTDQLGSASVSYRADGGNVVGQRYEPWGEVKGYEANQFPSDYSFTGQEDVNFTRAPNFYDPVRILDYGARYYWPAFGRFISPDSIVPEPGNPQSLNRYTYAANNPLRYTDPTGYYTNDEIKKYLQDTYGDDWQAYWDAWQADPYWMWVLGEAQDGYVLTAGLGGNVTFGHNEGSFTLGKGKLHEYQGQGVYALYNSDMELVKDRQWLVYRTESGTIGGLFLHSGMKRYYQPIYDYGSGKPVFKEWRKLEVDWSGQINWLAGTGTPIILERVAKMVPKVGPIVAAVGAVTLFDALVIAKADQVSVSSAPFDQWPPVSGPVPIPNQYQWPNPNGLYPAVPR